VKGFSRGWSDAVEPNPREEVIPITLIMPFKVLQPWQHKWQDLLDVLEQIEDVYTRSADTKHATLFVETFFSRCRELADRLWQDTRTGLDKSTVMAFIHSDPSLRLADAMAQTTKHHTRTGTNPITARVSRLNILPDAADVQIYWTQPSGADGTEDALDLARRCAGSWRSFFAREGLRPWSP
jgi:hypothetical protein